MARRRSGRRTDLRWTLASSNFLAVASGTAGVTALSSATFSETLLRTRGEMMCWVDGLEAPATLARVGVGLIVMPEGQGTTVISSPISDGDAPWLYHRQFTIGYEEYVTDVIQAVHLSSFREVVDVKAMRILRPDQEIQCVVEQTTIAGAVTLNLILQLRFLLGR